MALFDRPRIISINVTPGNGQQPANQLIKRIAPKLKIAIDGPAASGKSTTARLVAKNLGYIYVDTGAMYRAVTLAVLRREINASDQVAITRLAKELVIRFEYEEDQIKTYLNEEDVSEAIRVPEIGQLISTISAYKDLRKIMVKHQRRLAEPGGIVMDGRDIGTVVLPDAHIKIYMQADLSIRAERRCKELNEKGISAKLSDISQEIKRRDHLDSTREEGPLAPAADAIIIDTTILSIDQQVRSILDIINNYISAK